MSNLKDHYLEIAPLDTSGRWERTGASTTEQEARAQMAHILRAWVRWGHTNRQIRLVSLDWSCCEEPDDMPMTRVVETHRAGEIPFYNPNKLVT
jgi:hypothetical protein